MLKSKAENLPCNQKREKTERSWYVKRKSYHIGVQSDANLMIISGHIAQDNGSRLLEGISIDLFSSVKMPRCLHAA